MASTGVEKNKWTISLLNIQKVDNVLEIGFGPGIAIEMVSNINRDGYVVGIDYSDVMLQQAKKSWGMQLKISPTKSIHIKISSSFLWQLTSYKKAAFSLNYLYATCMLCVCYV